MKTLLKVLIITQLKTSSYKAVKDKLMSRANHFCLLSLYLTVCSVTYCQCFCSTMICAENFRYTGRWLAIIHAMLVTK